MQYLPVRGVGRLPQQTAAGRQAQAREKLDARKEYISTTFTALSKLLASEEYDEMLTQWRLGLRDVWLEDGFVMTCFTPARGD